MKISFLTLCILFTQIVSAQSWQKIHRKAIVVDTHNDILMQAADIGIVFDQDLTGKTHSDLTRWKKADWMYRFFLCIVMVTRKTLMPMPIGKWIVWML